MKDRGRRSRSLPPRTRRRPSATLLGRCLERDPRRRLQSIGEARIVIDDVMTGVAADENRPSAATPAHVAKWPFAVAALGVLAAASALGWMWTRPTPGRPAVTRFTVTPPENVVLTVTSPNATQMAVSPDGRFVAFVADELGACPQRSGCARSTRSPRSVSIAQKARTCRSGRRILSTSGISPTAS